MALKLWQGRMWNVLCYTNIIYYENFRINIGKNSKSIFLLIDMMISTFQIHLSRMTKDFLNDPHIIHMRRRLK